MSLTNYRLAKQGGIVYLYDLSGEVILSMAEHTWELIRKTDPAPTLEECAIKAFREWMCTAEDTTKRAVWMAAIDWYTQHKGEKQ